MQQTEFWNTPIRVGTDCSGIEAPIQALEQLRIKVGTQFHKIKFNHVFSCEIDKDCVKNIENNYFPDILFEDILTRDIKEVPDIDLYVSGFPSRASHSYCQPFSHAGKRKGFDDSRGNIFFKCLEVIHEKRPKYFILENVKGLLTHDNGKTWSKILEELGKTGYDIYHKVLKCSASGALHPQYERLRHSTK